MTKLLTAWLTLHSNQYHFHFSNLFDGEFKDMRFLQKSYVILTRRKKNILFLGLVPPWSVQQPTRGKK